MTKPPRPAHDLPTVRLAERLEPALAARHPWVYADHLSERGARLPSGAWVRVEAGGAAAIGLAEPAAPVALRLYRHAPAGGALAVPDRDWVRAVVAAALALRAPLVAAGEAHRMLFGEADGVPGVTADRYGRYAVIRTYAPSLRPGGPRGAGWLVQQVAEALGTLAGLRGVVWAAGPTASRPERGGTHDGDAEGFVGDGADAEGPPAAGGGPVEPVVLWGEAPPPELTVQDGGQTMLVEIGRGQKTGLFLDQRDNRRVVRALAGDRRVLDLFSYTGGFAVAALAGGARSVVSVDASAGALAAAERNVAFLGREAASRFRTERGDLMRDFAGTLRRAVERDGPPDLIVLDPPALARRKGQRHAALRAFRRLNAGAMEALEDGGLLATASCTAQVAPDAFRDAVAAAATDVGVIAQVLHEAGHTLDHPVSLAFPEGRYLTFLLLRVLRPR